jgi:hypothetical protein
MCIPGESRGDYFARPRMVSPSPGDGGWLEVDRGGWVRQRRCRRPHRTDGRLARALLVGSRHFRRAPSSGGKVHFRTTFSNQSPDRSRAAEDREGGDALRAETLILTSEP